MRAIVKQLILALALLSIFPHFSAAQTIKAASCSQSDVQAALNSVSSSTTVVNIPAGTCHWASHILWAVPSGSSTLSILGAGSLTTQGGGDATVIIDDDGTDNNHLLNITTGAAPSFFRFAGITIQGGTGQYKQTNAFDLGGQSNNVRIDHNHFNGLTYTTANPKGLGLRTGGCIYGVFDHNVVEAAGKIETWMGGCYGDTEGDGDLSWATATNFGSSQAFFIETNTFNLPLSACTTGGHECVNYMTDCYAGGRQVIRFNTLNNLGVQVHPTGGAGRIRGCRSSEVYQNQFISTNPGGGNPIYVGFWLSSGTALVWGNTFTPASFLKVIELHSMRRNNSTYPQVATPYGWGYCGTSFNGTGSAWDQASNTSSGDRCLDQPGMGAGQALNQQPFPNTLNRVTGTIAWPQQALEPVYEWMDTWSAVPNQGNSMFIGNTDPTTLTQNVNYYVCSTPGASTCAGFTGTAGVGTGLYSAIPSTCTPMVAYWATDQNTLYQCSALGTWSAYYRPYTYPHPLVTGGQDVPLPPANVTVIVN